MKRLILVQAIICILFLSACGGSSSNNVAPTVSITGPLNDTSVVDGTELSFTATAIDNEDGDIGATTNWNSNIDGDFGTGSTVNATLSVGLHIITASVIDSSSLPGSQQITVTVTEPLQVGGIWKGPAIEIISGLTQEILILTTADGQFRLVSNFAVQAEGMVVLREDDDEIDDLDGTVTVFAPQGYFFSGDAETSGCTIEAVLEERIKIEGSYSCINPKGTDSGTFSATYQSIYEQDSSIARVAGVWSNPDLTVTIDNEGSIISGQFSNGCVVTGSMAGTIDTDFNLYSLYITVDRPLLPLPGGGGTCSEFAKPTVDYLGLTFLKTDDPFGAQDALTLQIDNGTNIATQILLR
jgi:hypothetical protein